MSEKSRYVIGIDLGTTNCALAYVDTAPPVEERRVRTLSIPQLVAPGEIQALPVLPSFIYLPEAHDVRSDMLRLPWQCDDTDIAVGTWARDMAAKVPGKVVSSAKSWLCYEGLDRRQRVLPFDRQEVPRQISPVDAARLCLEHLREAWNDAMAREDTNLALQRQTVVLTVPASFDAVARELTVEAAEAAGLTVRLVEEPQAAFYAWLHEQGDGWRESVRAGDLVLVCDVGGGTTDFSLIAVEDRDGNLELERIAVGDHILLGGDNMDLTLAYRVAATLEKERGTKLDAYQIAGLAHACREAKEKLAHADADSRQPLTVLGRGTGVIGGTMTTELKAGEIADYLEQGFLPDCTLNDRPRERRRMGLRTFGLDYASDPALTRHLAAFLGRHAPGSDDGGPRMPSAVLFNGGVTRSPLLRTRVRDVLRSWQNGEHGGLTVLEESHPDLGVAAGAAWYAVVQREGGVRIKSGSARSYYIGVEASMPAIPGMPAPVEALCVVNFGMEEGAEADVPAEGLGLIVGEPTEFRCFSSTVRNDDSIGTLLEDWRDDELEEMPPLVVELPAEDATNNAIGAMVPVTLRSVMTEIGTLQVWCRDQRRDRRWKLEFELREDASVHEEQ